MQLTDFEFELPEELIAQYPPPARDDARLMVVERARQTMSCGVITHLADYLRAGDVLVVNDTAVRPARLLGRRDSGGRVEVFLLRRLDGVDEVWRCMTRSSKPLRPGTVIRFADGVVGEVLADAEVPLKLVRFSGTATIAEQLARIGEIPLPPYIQRPAEPIDRERYQTIFAQTPGAVAAPTAGLHFTPSLLAQLQSAGVEVVSLTLHVGIGTFAPVRVTNIAEHRMHGETYIISEQTAASVNRAKAEGRRVIAVGTTSTRALEAVMRIHGKIVAGEGETDIFITPGFSFQIVDALLTNFHLPGSTLLMLVSAFAGHDLMHAAYRRAVAERFRFFSYGDCMLIL